MLINDQQSMTMLIDMLKAMLGCMLTSQNIENSKLKTITDVDDIQGVDQSLLC